MKLNRLSPRTWMISLFSFAWIVWISGVFGNNGILQAYNLSNTRHELSMRIKALDNENAKLEHSLKMLAHDSFVQEKAIRETIGFVRENEIIFEFR